MLIRGSRIASRVDTRAAAKVAFLERKPSPEPRAQPRAQSPEPRAQSPEPRAQSLARTSRSRSRPSSAAPRHGGRPHRTCRNPARRPASRRFRPTLRAPERRRVTALRRRARYLLAELESGETLLMHLGMSGSFRVVKGQRDDVPGGFYFERSLLEAHDHVLFTMSSGVTVVFNDPRRFGVMSSLAWGARTSRAAGARAGAARARFQRHDSGSRAEGQEDQSQGGAFGSACRRGSRQHLCVRSPSRGAAVAETARVDAGDRDRGAPPCGQGADSRCSSRTPKGHRQPPSSARQRSLPRLRSRR